MKKAFYSTMMVVAVLIISLGLAIASSASYKYATATLGDGTLEPFTMMAYERDGIGGWDKCEAQFYFDREKFNFASGTELAALRATLPSCRLTKVRDGSLLKSAEFSTYNTREFLYSDNYCYLTYGIKLQVTIPEQGGSRTYILYDHD